MKKLIVLFLVAILCLSGCGSVEKSTSTGVSQEEYYKLQSQYNELKAEYDALVSSLSKTPETIPPTQPSGNTNVIPAGKFDADSVISQLEITEYSYYSRYSYYAFLAIKNNSIFDLDISISVKFYDDNGKLIGAQSNDEPAFERGTEILFYFIPDEAYTEMEYEITVKEEEWYDCVVSNLSYETVSAKEKEIVSVTNNGTEAAEFVQGSILFFKEDQVVDFDFTYFTDDDSEIKPGKTITKELDCYEEYDSFKIFFTGRR